MTNRPTLFRCSASSNRQELRAQLIPKKADPTGPSLWVRLGSIIGDEENGGPAGAGPKT